MNIKKCNRLSEKCFVLSYRNFVQIAGSRSVDNRCQRVCHISVGKLRCCPESTMYIIGGAECQK